MDWLLVAFPKLRQEEVLTTRELRDGFGNLSMSKRTE
jgi:hypothetical protein